MSEQPEHYTPQYIGNGASKNPFSPGYGVYHRQAGSTRVVQKKSLVIAYILWFFLGTLGAHKLYLRQPFMCLFYLILNGLGWLTAGILVGYLFFILLGLLLFIDLFTMPLRVRIMNALAHR